MKPASLSRRATLVGGSLILAGVGGAQAQTAAERTRKFEGWVQHILNTIVNLSPMTNGRILGFPTEEVQRKQIGLRRGGVQRLFAVVVPIERNGIILAAGNAETLVFGVHRTGTHLRRIASGRNAGGQVSRWSGPACEQDFQSQVDFWLALPVG